MRSAKTDRELGVNRWPVNRLALRWLREARLPVSPDLPYLVQLLSQGFEADLPLLGQGQKYRADLDLAAGQLLDPSLNPADVMRWLTNSPSGPSPSEQLQTLQSSLEQAKSWQEAAQNLMEWFYDRISAENPYYR
jgi:hypothetical protein